MYFTNKHADHRLLDECYVQQVQQEIVTAPITLTGSIPYSLTMPETSSFIVAGKGADT